MIDAEGIRRSFLDLAYGLAGVAIGVFVTIFARRIKIR